MNRPDTQDKLKQNIHSRDRAKHAISLAMNNSWPAAVEANLAILAITPNDLEAHNRLGKALTELGQLDEARSAFEQALKLSPHNPIAVKNLDRLMHVGDQIPIGQPSSNTSNQTFIEDSGKTVVTSLINLAPPSVLLQIRPGQHVSLSIHGTAIKISNSSEEQVGNIEPKLASRLIRLIEGGNRYEATVTRVGESGMMVIVNEVFRNPSLSEATSFSPKLVSDQKTYLNAPATRYSQGVESSTEVNRTGMKDWSDDDTEPGDDDAFSPAIHRIINPEDEEAEKDDEY